MQKKYKLSKDAVQDLIKLDQFELALRTINESYNELYNSVWHRIRQSYYLDMNKEYKFVQKGGMLVEV